jgi:hypothetical protein
LDAKAKAKAKEEEEEEALTQQLSSLLLRKPHQSKEIK